MKLLRFNFGNLRFRNVFLLLPLLLLAQAQAGDPGRKWRICVGWSYFLSRGGDNNANAMFYPDLHNQKGPNNWFFPSLGFEYRFKPKWNVSASVTTHPYMLITKYQVGRDVYSWKEGKHTLGVAIGPTLSWSTRSDEGFNYKFDRYRSASESFPILFGLQLGLVHTFIFGKYSINVSLLTWFSQSFIYASIRGRGSFFYYGYLMRSYYNNPLNDYFITEKEFTYYPYSYERVLKSVFMQGLFIDLTFKI